MKYPYDVDSTEGLGDVDWSPVINEKNRNLSLDKFYDWLDYDWFYWLIILITD